MGSCNSSDGGGVGGGGGGWQGNVMSNHLIDKILYQSLMVKNIIVTKLKYLEGSVVQKLFSFYPRCTDTYKKYL